MCNFGSPQPGALTSNLAHKVVGRNNHFTPTRYGHWIQRAERAGPFSPPTLVDPRSPSFSNGRYMTLFLWPLSVATCSPAPSGPHWAFPVSGSSTPPRGFWRRLFRRPRGPLEPCGRALVHAILDGLIFRVAQPLEIALDAPRLARLANAASVPDQLMPE
jgi:hypothetical protein